MRFKNIRFIVMIMILSSMMFACVHTTNAKKVKLSDSKITLYTGKSKTIKMIGATSKVKWSVNKKLVTLKTSGKKHQKVTIKAKTKTGTCIVKATMKKKTYQCKVTIKKKTTSQSQNYTDMTASYKPQKIKTKDTDQTFSYALSQNALDLLKECLSANKKDTNTLISPDSIVTALALLENGAANQTLKEMEKVLGDISVEDYNRYLATLHKRLTSSKKTTYQIANSFWYKNQTMTPSSDYLQKIVDYYQSEIYQAPFNQQTVSDINNWCSEKTNKKIKKIIDQLSPSAQAALINAIYFKGAWEEPYHTTTKRTFTQNDGTKKETDMLEGVEHDYLKVKGAEGFVKYYAEGKTAFVGLLPPKDQSISEFVSSLSGEDLIKAYQNRVTEHIDVITRMPEFKYEYGLSLKNPLKNIGMKQIFTDQADFSAMAKQSLCVDDVLHKTYINLNKEGTEAAAVTAVLVKETAMYDEEKITKKVYLNRPFVYAIIDTESGIPLFIGTVYNLSA